MKYRAESENISINDIKEIEKSLGIKLPKDYVNHMLKFNGIDPQGDYYYKPDIWEDEINFSYILPIHHGTYTFNKANKIKTLEDFPEMQVMIGATTTGNLSMSLKKEDNGSIYVYYSDGEIHKLADSFTEFLQRLEEYEDD